VDPISGAPPTPARGFPSLACLWLLFSLALRAADVPGQGSLVIVGGGGMPDVVLGRFVRLAGGASARIVVMPMASGVPDEAARDAAADFARAGATNCRAMRLDRAQADADPAVRALAGVRGVFFSGGDQSRLAAALVGTRVAARLHALHREGAVIGGTSAGAAIMSAVMLTGEERGRPEGARDFAVIRKGSVVVAEGLGFVTNAVIDQHFVARRRQNRLFAAVLERPALLGAGIDERTALVVGPDGSWEALGDGVVTVVDARRAAVAADRRGNLSAVGVALHLLADGMRFDPRAAAGTVAPNGL
jgi:cyanophycinase